MVPQTPKEYEAHHVRQWEHEVSEYRTQCRHSVERVPDPQEPWLRLVVWELEWRLLHALFFAFFFSFRFLRSLRSLFVLRTRTFHRLLQRHARVFLPVLFEKIQPLVCHSLYLGGLNFLGSFECT